MRGILDGDAYERAEGPAGRELTHPTSLGVVRTRFSGMTASPLLPLLALACTQWPRPSAHKPEQLARVEECPARRGPFGEERVRDRCRCGRGNVLDDAGRLPRFLQTAALKVH